jgi:thiamine kinase-like enzyme
LRLLEELSNYDAPPVLLQNDFGKRNIFLRRDTGQLVVIDFERAGVGDAHWELGKLWDRELREDPAIRHAFLQGYRAQRGLLDEEWPDPALLWLIRFLATLTIFPYASRVGDRPFFEHGLLKLKLVEAESSQWT